MDIQQQEKTYAGVLRLIKWATVISAISLFVIVVGFIK